MNNTSKVTRAQFFPQLILYMKNPSKPFVPLKGCLIYPRKGRKTHKILPFSNKDFLCLLCLYGAGNMSTLYFGEINP